MAITLVEPLDCICFLDTLLCVHGCSVHPVLFSDRCLVSCDRQRCRNCRLHWELWKFNHSLLPHGPSVNRVQSTRDRYDLPWFARWELFKQVKVTAVEEATVMAVEKNKTINHSNKFLRELYELESRYPGQYRDNIRNVKAQATKAERRSCFSSCIKE